MVYQTIAFTLDIIGKVMVGIAVVMVHSRVIKEKRIDEKVITEIQHERYLSITGIILMVAGYLFHFLP